jgi:two-component system, OmpR family, sensor histidine kinase MprB
MPLRRRLALVSAAGVAVALILVSLVCYFVVRRELRGQVDDSLRAQADQVAGGDLRALGDQGIPAPSPRMGGPAQYSQIVAADGKIVAALGGVQLPIDATVRSVAQGRLLSAFEDLHVDGSHLRMLAFGVGGGAVELARPLDSIDRVISNLRLILLLLCAAGIALAAGVSRLIARRVLAPLAEVASTAQHISETDDLTRRIDIRSDDEVGELVVRFNLMLDRLETSRSALDRSVRDQRQLVADASHELRTPITSLRTNIEVLLENPNLPEHDRRQLLNDVVEQTEELTALVAGLIELGRGDLRQAPPEHARLDELVEEATARARRNAPTVEFDAKLEPVTVECVPERLGHALNNLLDNAARHSPPGEVVQISLSDDGLRVRDHGSGIDPEDLPHIFDRFYRGTNSRGRPGSGLGLAIVRQVVQQHGGSISATNAPDGGAIFHMQLPADALASNHPQDQQQA